MLAALLSLIAAAPAATHAPDEAALSRAVGDRVPGTPIDCLPVSPSDVTSTEIVDGTAIVYRIGSRVYVNRPSEGASALRRDDILVSQIVTGRLCHNDPVTLADPISPIPHGAITLGAFIPYGRRQRGGPAGG